MYVLLIHYELLKFLSIPIEYFLFFFSNYSLFFPYDKLFQ